MDPIGSIDLTLMIWLTLLTELSDPIDTIDWTIWCCGSVDLIDWTLMILVTFD